MSFTTAGKHWLPLWDKGVGAFFDFGGSWAIRQLARLTSGFEPDEVDMGVGDVAALESFMWEMVDVFLSEGQAAALTRMIQIYINNTRWSKDMSAAESVLQRIVDKVDSMRTEDWQGDYDRKPRLLPSTFDIKLETLRMLYSLKDDRDSVPMDEEDRSRLATKTMALIRDMAANEMPYHIVFEKLKASLAREARSCIQVAVLIGSVDDLERPVISDYLRVDLAAAMLEQKTYFHGKVDKWDGHVVEVVKKMLDSWERSPIEYIRNAARPFGTE